MPSVAVVGTISRGDGRLGSVASSTESWAFNTSKGCQSGFQGKGSHNHDGVPISAGVRKNDS